MARMRKYVESKTTRIMMATVPHVTSGLGLRKFQADGFLLTRVYVQRNTGASSCNHCCSGKAICNTYCGSVCSLSYPVCIAHAPYCHLWPARLCSIFPHYL